MRLIEWCHCSTDAKGVVFVRICDDSADPVELVQRALMEAKQSGVNLTKHVQAQVPCLVAALSFPAVPTFVTSNGHS